MSELIQDIRYGIRNLKASPGFTAVAILTLALGIGANTAIFSFVDGVMLKPLPYANADRIMRVLEKPPGTPDARNGISTLNYLDWKNGNTSFEYMAAQTGGSVTLSGIQEPVLLRGARVSAHYFDIFGVTPVLGRAFLDDEDQLGKNQEAILSHTLWETRFGSDPSIIGRTILLDNLPHTVVGVLPAGSAFDRAFSQIWRPLAFEPSNMTRNFHWFGAFGLLKPGVSLQQARAEMDGIGKRIAHDFPDSNKGWSVAVDPYAQIIVGAQLKTSLYVLLAAVAMVLLIGCANLANLALVRGSGREREVAVRAALGASRGRLIRQFLTENVLLSLFGGMLGIAVGYATMKGLTLLVPPNSLPREAKVAMDGRVLLFALAISILTGLLFGLAPALQLTRPDLSSSMKDGGRGSSTGGSRRRLRDVLVIVEVAMAFALLVASGLLIRSFFHLIQVNAGFDSTNVLTLQLPIPVKRYPDPQQLNQYLAEVRTAVDAVPGVEETSLASALPLQGWGYGMPFQIASRPTVDRANRDACFFKMVTPSYFHSLGIRLLKGRGLSDRDRKGGPPVTVINETMAKKYFKGEEPVGQRILIQEIIPGKTELGSEIAWEVVGVIADEKIGGLNDEKSAGVYVSNEQSPAYGVGMIIRAGIDPSRIEAPIRRAVAAVNKDQALADIQTLEKIKTDSVGGTRLQISLLSVFAAIALALAAIGLYGVLSFTVVQRTHDLGIRAALGASDTDLIGSVLGRGMVLTLIGLVTGAGFSLGITGLLATLLFGVTARDPATMASVALILAAVALFACYIPARRATKVDPLVALRYE
jgi:putative ABC transport system permease protein